ncbi:MAG: DUF2207 domain-containing protein, partial [Nostocoides sp.]
MRRLVLSALAALALILGMAPALAHAAALDRASGLDRATSLDRGFAAVGVEERIGSYVNAMELRRDGSVAITETIEHIFPDGAERHGITRDIRVRAGYQDRDDVYRYYRLSDLQVSSPSGAPVDVQESDFGAYVHLRIGSPDEVVSGTHTYVIAYTLADVVNVIDTERAEFVHDVVGIANEQWYDEIVATVAAPEVPLQVGCNYGGQGSDSLCESSGGSPSSFGHSDLEPGQAMTVALSLPRSAFDGEIGPNLIEGSTSNEDIGADDVSPALTRRLGQLTGGLGLFIPLLAAAGMATLVWTRGRDEAYAGLTPGLTPGAGEQASIIRRARPAPIAVAFTPPAGVQPGMIGTLIDESADTVDVTATLLDLAVRGFLTITETEKAWRRTDWLLTQTTPPPNARALSDYEEVLLQGVFADGPRVRLSELKNTFASTLTAVQGSMYGEVVRRGWFRRSPQSQRNSWSGLGAVLFFLGLAAIFFLGNVLPAGRPLSALPLSGTTILGLGLIVSALIVNLLGRRMASRTADGSAVLAQALGFRQYLVTAEANQIRFEEAQQIFSTFLPYAIVFGVAEKWAKTFQEVAAAAAAAGVAINAPNWYVGPSWGTGGMFDSVTSGVDDFATQAAGTFISTPGSSGDSVFSGGGGFSG